MNDFAQSYTDVLDSPRLLGADRTSFGLPAAGVVYANYNNLQKLQPWVFDGWCGSVEPVLREYSRTATTAVTHGDQRTEWSHRRQQP